MPDRRRIRALALETTLTVGAILGVVCIVASIAVLAFGITPLVFRSGSMSPAIPTGSVAIARSVPAADVSEGDVVSVQGEGGSRITHRVDGVGAIAGNSVTLSLKGDANAEPDASPYVVTEVDRVSGSVPYLGYVVAWASTPTAMAAGGLAAVALLLIVFWPDRRRKEGGDRGAPTSGGRHSADDPGTDRLPVWRTEGVHSHGVRGDRQRRDRGWDGESGGGRHAAIPVVLVIALAVGLGIGRTDSTGAALTDTAVGRVSVSTGTVTRPASFTCTNVGVLSVELSWPVVNPSYRYVIQYSGGLLTAPIRVEYPAQASGTVRITPPGDVLSLGATASLYSLVGTNFVSSPPLVRTMVKALGLIALCSPAGTTNSTTKSAAQRAAPSSSSSTTPSTTTSEKPTDEPGPTPDRETTTTTTPPRETTTTTTPVPAETPAAQSESSTSES